MSGRLSVFENEKERFNFLTLTFILSHQGRGNWRAKVRPAKTIFEAAPFVPCYVGVYNSCFMTPSPCSSPVKGEEIGEEETELSDATTGGRV